MFVYDQTVSHFDQPQSALSQDNLYATDPTSIINPYGNVIACLESEGNNIFINIWSLTKEYLTLLPHIKITSQQPREPHKIELPATKYYVKEETG